MTKTLRKGDRVLVGWGKIGPDGPTRTSNTFVATVVGFDGDRVILTSTRGKTFTMKVGGPWFRGMA